MKTSKIQLERVREWEKRNPERAQARKNAWWKTKKGKAAIERRRKKFNAYRRRWRAEKRSAKVENEEVRDPARCTPELQPRRDGRVLCTDLFRRPA